VIVVNEDGLALRERNQAHPAGAALGLQEPVERLSRQAVALQVVRPTPARSGFRTDDAIAARSSLPPSLQPFR
jgi:hypothetical protein